MSHFSNGDTVRLILPIDARVRVGTIGVVLPFNSVPERERKLWAFSMHDAIYIRFPKVSSLVESKNLEIVKCNFLPGEKPRIVKKTQGYSVGDYVVYEAENQLFVVGKIEDIECGPGKNSYVNFYVRRIGGKREVCGSASFRYKISGNKELIIELMTLLNQMMSQQKALQDGYSSELIDILKRAREDSKTSRK